MGSHMTSMPWKCECYAIMRHWKLSRPSDLYASLIHTVLAS